MNNLSSISGQMENLREKLNFLLSKENNLSSCEVITISQELDEVLNQYNDIND